MDICKLDDCNRERHAKGFCHKHYSQLLKNGIVKSIKGFCKFDGCCKEFIRKRSSHIFCSDKCRDAFQAKTNKSIQSKIVYRNTDRCKLLTNIRREKYRLSGRTKKHYEKSRNLYPEKRIAGYMAYSNFKNAEICSIEGCQEEGQRHHPDYSKPLDIVWLCREHHTKEHNKIRRLSSHAFHSSRVLQINTGV